MDIRKHILFIEMGFIAIGFFGCADDQDSAPIDIEFRLLNGLGEPSTSFEVGENFVFSFLITNNSDEIIRLDQQSVDTVDFFRVYSTTIQDESGNPISFGKPYKLAFCHKINGLGIFPHETLRLEIPWMPNPWEEGVTYYSGNFCLVNENEPLTAGHYQTSFSSTLNFITGAGDISVGSKTFQVNFSVE